MKITKASEIKRGHNFSALIYGKPGSGKTTTIKYLKGRTLVVDIDRTSNVLSGIENIDIVYADLNDVEIGMKKLLKDIHDNYLQDYDNVVIDNLSEFEQAWLAEKSRQSMTTKGEQMGIPQMGDYNKYSFYLPDMIRYINSWEGINKIYTAWENTVQIQTPNGQLFNQFHPQIREKVLNNVLGLVNIAGRLVANDENGKRGFLLKSTSSTFAKNQIDNRDFSLQEDLFNFGDVDKESDENV